MRKGFTLPEILVSVMIVAILVVMAVPQYEKAVEKSRKADVLSNLKKLHESKMRTLDSADLQVYNGTFGMENLDFTLPCTNVSYDSHRIGCQTKDFYYKLRPDGLTSSSPAKEWNAVCARRIAGDAADTVFVYYGEEETNADDRFVCKGNACEVYGMTSSNGVPKCN